MRKYYRPRTGNGQPLAMLVLCLFLVCPGPARALAEDIDYSEYWKSLPAESKIVLLTSYVRGYNDGAMTFGHLYMKLFGKALTPPQIEAGEKLSLVRPDNLVEVRLYLYEFLNNAYMDSDFKQVNIYDMMRTGVACSGSRLPYNECLFLFGDYMKARADQN